LSIPKDACEELGIVKGDEFQVSIEENGLTYRKNK